MHTASQNGREAFRPNREMPGKDPTWTLMLHLHCKAEALAEFLMDLHKLMINLLDYW